MIDGYEGVKNTAQERRKLKKSKDLQPQQTYDDDE